MPSSPKYAVLLVHLGTPAEPTVSSVRKFLRSFLSDPRVIEVPRPIWFFILNLIILPVRPIKIAPIYKRVWDKYGDSPLRLIAKKQHGYLQERLDAHYGKDYIKVFTATSYAENRVGATLSRIQQLEIEKVVVLPLYPQFSASTTGAVYDQVAAYVQSQRNLPELHIAKQYFDRPSYQKALADSVSDYWQAHGKSDLLLISFHGLPQSYVDKGDPYYRQCLQTAENLAEKLSLEKGHWHACFQSNVGRAEWLRPYTSQLLQKIAGEGVKSVDVVCPSFSADCIETVEEIAEENRVIFETAGGKQLRLIPSLNDRDDHIKMMEEIISESINKT